MSKNYFKDKGKVSESWPIFRKNVFGFEKSVINGGQKLGYADQNKAKFSSACSNIAVYHFFVYFYRMKFFAFIMAFLVLTLSILPCADEGFIMKEGKVKTEITKQHGQQDNQEHQEHNDACSPFCHCTCCAGSTISHFLATATSLICIESKFYTSYLPGNPIQYSPPIWQPPKAS